MPISPNEGYIKRSREKIVRDFESLPMACLLRFILIVCVRPLSVVSAGKKLFSRLSALAVVFHAV